MYGIDEPLGRVVDYFKGAAAGSDVPARLLLSSRSWNEVIYREELDRLIAQRVPAAKALKEWGTAHRYAGSGDRAAISGLIWDVLRRRASSAWIMARIGVMPIPPAMNTLCVASGASGK